MYCGIGILMDDRVNNERENTMQRECINAGWLFSKEVKEIPEELPQNWETVNLPHTWNGTDGQDGGNDYYRGTCYYAKELTAAPMQAGEQIYLEFCGANSSASLYVNGTRAGAHDGGYSTWRVNITELWREKNLIVVAVDNAPNERVYPQMADFTFYGGLYRDVNLIRVGESHFDLDYCGSTAVKVTPVVQGEDAEVTAEVFLTGEKAGQTLHFAIYDTEETGEEQLVAEQMTTVNTTVVKLIIPKVHLWNGTKDAHLYRLKVRLMEQEACLDERSLRFGCRTFEVDPQRGFFLNGRPYPLRGVSRHQDRPVVGNALLPEHHREDMDLICEMGANTIRLAHYQHDQYFYDLCDERGMVIWAEIPYISNHMPDGYDNTMSQMRELIVQNYHHPSIVVWGLSNEITMHGAKDDSMLKNHRDLNELVHRLDPTRLTTEAVVTMCGIDEEYVHIPDVVSYNHYFGWYGGDTSMNGPWFDKFHEKYPNRAIGISEYGCEALDWHTSEPEQGDYTEEYQAFYHEELIRQINERPYLWATHVWNMFDFAADARAEGGESGMNHKGLVTFDRKYKKDAFYAYKAWLSDEPFVHICGKRYERRVEDVTRVTVYTNQPEVELFANGESLGRQKRGEVPFFYYDVQNCGETKLIAVAGACRDESGIVKVDVFPEEYRMKEEGAVINWFEIDMPEGYLSINDKLGDIMKPLRGKLVLLRLILMLKSQGKQNAGEKDKGKKKEAGVMGFSVSKEMIELAKGFTMRRALGMLGGGLTKEQYLKLNASLNRIRKN